MPTKKILFVVTSNAQLGDTGEKTGYHLSEVTHPYYVLQEAGFSIDFASPQGGDAPVDPNSVDKDDDKNSIFLNDEKAQEAITNTRCVDDVNVAEYQAIYFPGGHGTMWDFPGNPAIARIIKSIYEQGGIVAAVCHGPSALVNAKLSNGQYLVSGKTVTCFSNAEEDAVDKSKVMPFMLETRLAEHGAHINVADLWQNCVSVDQRLITGQNPASAEQLGHEMVSALNEQD